MLNSWPLAKDLQVLVEIVHSGSFSAAAATLGQTPAFVTKRIDPAGYAADQTCSRNRTGYVHYAGNLYAVLHHDGLLYDL